MFIFQLYFTAIFELTGIKYIDFEVGKGINMSLPVHNYSAYTSEKILEDYDAHNT